MPEEGNTRSVLVAVDGGDLVEFAQTLTVGRHPDNGLVLGDPQISSRHAVLEWTHTGCQARDLGSRNGTSLNGKRIRGWTSVKNQDVLRFGGASAWRVESLAPPPPPLGQLGYVEVLGSGRRVPIDADRFLIGTSATVDLRVPEWVDRAEHKLRAVLYEESHTLWLQPVHGIPGIVVGGRPWRDSPPVRIVRETEIHLDDTQLRIVPVQARDPVKTTAVRDRPGKHYDLDLHLTFEGPDEGTIAVVRGADRWHCRAGQRFVLLYLLARARGDWAADRDLRVKLWGAARAREMGRNALHKLIYDTRQMLMAADIDGWFIEKRRGQTRLRLAPDRIHIVEHS